MSCCGNHCAILTLLGIFSISSSSFHRTLCGNFRNTFRISILIFRDKTRSETVPPKLKYMTPCSPEPDIKSSKSGESGFGGWQCKPPNSWTFGELACVCPIGLTVFSRTPCVCLLSSFMLGVFFGKYFCILYSTQGRYTHS